MLIWVCWSGSAFMNWKQAWGVASMPWASQIWRNTRFSASAFGLGSS